MRCPKQEQVLRAFWGGRPCHARNLFSTGKELWSHRGGTEVLEAWWDRGVMQIVEPGSSRVAVALKKYVSQH